MHDTENVKQLARGKIRGVLWSHIQNRERRDMLEETI